MTSAATLKIVDPALEQSSAAKPAQPVALPHQAETVPDDRYERMSGKLVWLVKNISLPAITFALAIGIWSAIASYVAPDLPGPAATIEHGIDIFSEPFYDAGPNDKGIGWQLLYSLGRVMAGFGLAVAVGIPVGLLMGASEICQRAWQPLVDILRPVSPLAWLPIGLLIFRSVDPSAIFVIFITCIWPTLINTAAGVRAIPSDYTNVAKVLNLSRWETTRRIYLPAIVPHMITGMRLSLGIAWMVIVAAEMLTGGIGIGFYVWDEWNNLNVKSIIVAIVTIGLVGIALEWGMLKIQQKLDYAS